PPMTNLKKTAAAAMLGGALLAPNDPAKAGPPITVPAPLTVPIQAIDKAEADRMNDQLKKANDKLNDIQSQLTKLTELLEGRRDDKGFKVPDSGLVEEFKNLRNTLHKIEGDVETLKQRMQSSTSQRVPTPAQTSIVDPNAGKSIVRIINEYPI